MKFQNQYINIMKALAAFLVVFIHVPFPGLAGSIVTAIARISVPFFFWVSDSIRIALAVVNFPLLTRVRVLRRCC